MKKRREGERKGERKKERERRRKGGDGESRDVTIFSVACLLYSLPWRPT